MNSILKALASFFEIIIPQPSPIKGISEMDKVQKGIDELNAEYERTKKRY